MRIVIDARTVRQPRSGIGRAVERLCGALAAGFPSDQFLIITLKNQTTPAVAEFPNVEIEQTTHDYERHGPAEIWLNHGLVRLVERWHGDVLHGPAFLIPWRRTRFVRVTTIMDLIAFRVPENYSIAFRTWMKFITRQAARGADAVIVPAQYVADEMEYFIKRAGGKVHIVPLGPGLDEAEIDLTRGEGVLPKPPYILFVGKLEGRKDLRTVLQAFTIAKQRDDLPHHLVIVGEADPHNKDAVGQMNRHAYREQITWLDKPLNDGAMHTLYRRAGALVFASRCEGFGLPLIEAMRHGVPIVAANTATAPEICGEAALYFEPGTPPDLADRLRRLTQYPQLAQSLANEGRRRAEAFTWTRAARLTYDVYQRAVQKSK